MVAEGHAQGPAEFEQRLRSCFELACQATLGPDPDDDKFAVVFNRVLAWCDEGLRWEADPRHIEIAVAELGLLPGKSVRSPAVKDKTGPDGSALLSPEATRAYRGVAARLNFRRRRP